MLARSTPSLMSRHLLMMALATCLFVPATRLARAQPGAEFGPLPHVSYEAVTPAPWFSHPAVKEELNWRNDAHQQMVARYGNLFAQYTEDISRLPKNLSPAQRRQRERELMQNFHQHLQSSLDESLQDEAARARYEQLHLQYQGNSVVHHPQVQERLKLTKEQRERLLKEDREWNQALQNYWKKHKTDPKAAEQEFEAAREKLSERMTNTLNSSQQETWKQMTGKPYRFPSDAYLTTHPENQPAKAEKSAQDK